MSEHTSGLPTPQTATKCRDPGKVILGFLVMVAGGLGFMHLFPSTVSYIVGGALLILGALSTRAWQCSHCHARVDHDEVQCPRCALPFSTKS
jgi:hypothetical protein